LSPTRENPIVYYVTDRKGLGSGDPVAALRERIRLAIEAGINWVQVREKDLSARELLSVARDAVAAAQCRGGAGLRKTIRVIVNDRLDVALAAGAAGVHLGGESVPAREVVRWCRNGNAPATFWVGVSCHNLTEAREAEEAGANYVFFGPIFDTPSKRMFGAPQGVERLAEVCTGLRIPVIAIGGVNAENAADCLRVRAAGVAAIRVVQEAANLGVLRATITKLRELK